MRNIAKLVSKAAWLLLCLALAGCSEGVPAAPSVAALGGENTVMYGRKGEWALSDGSALVLSTSGALELRTASGAITVANEVIGLPSASADGARFAFAQRVPRGSGTAIAVVSQSMGAWTEPRILTDAGDPDLVSISEDGARVAFVAQANGIAAVWVVPFDGGAPVQLTNVGLVRDGSGPPAGFVPIPLRDPPRFEGRELVWTARDGEHRAVLP
jgi:hypothetical protein